jgi:hypothetical protein
MRSPWSGVAHQVFLKNLYDAGTSIYTYPRNEMIDQEPHRPILSQFHHLEAWHCKATITIEDIIQANEVSHTMLHVHVYQSWNERLVREMYAAI